MSGSKWVYKLDGTSRYTYYKFIKPLKNLSYQTYQCGLFTHYLTSEAVGVNNQNNENIYLESGFFYFDENNLLTLITTDKTNKNYNLKLDNSQLKQFDFTEQNITDKSNNYIFELAVNFGTIGYNLSLLYYFNKYIYIMGSNISYFVASALELTNYGTKMISASEYNIQPVKQSNDFKTKITNGVLEITSNVLIYFPSREALNDFNYKIENTETLYILPVAQEKIANTDKFKIIWFHLPDILVELYKNDFENYYTIKKK